MIIKSKKRVTVSISKETKEFLDSIKHTGQSYEGLIRELVVCWRKKQEADETKLTSTTEASLEEVRLYG